MVSDFGESNSNIILSKDWESETADQYTIKLVLLDGTEVISVEKIAQQADTFNYEMVCGISRRVPRFYYKDGKLVHQVHYLLDN